MNSKIASAMMAGVQATAVMTAVFFAARALDRRAQPPPETLLESAADRVGLEWAKPRLGFMPAWLALHFAYGTVVGPLGYVLVRRWLPEGSVLAGVTYGEVDWAVDYLLLWPLLGLYPWPHKDPWPRAAANFLGHAVYGAVLGKTARGVR